MPGEIVLVSSWVNHPEMMKLHRDLWVQAFLGESVRYIVYIDAKDYPDQSNLNDPSIRMKLINECVEHNIEFHLVAEEFHRNRGLIIPICHVISDNKPSARDVLVCHMAWRDQVLQNPNVKRIGLIQPDIFPYRRVNWNDITRGSEFYYKPQQRNTLSYAWNGLCLFSIETWTQTMKELVDFQDGFQKGIFTDSGGGLWKLMETLPKAKQHGWSGYSSYELTSRSGTPDLPYWIMEHLRADPRNKVDADGFILYYSELQDNWCFHLRAGCNWDGAGKEIHDARYSNLLRFLKDALDDDSAFLI